MEVVMKENSKMEKLMVKVRKNGLTGLFIKGNSQQVKNTVMGKLNMEIQANGTKENGISMLDKVKENSSPKTEILTQ